MTALTEARWRKVFFSPQWGKVINDPHWSKEVHRIYGLFTLLTGLLMGSIVMVAHSKEFWLLSIPAISLIATYLGSKFLGRRYESIFNFLAEDKCIGLDQSLPSPPADSSKTFYISVLIITLAATVVFFFGTAAALEKAKQSELVEYQMRQR
jgi:hypothetical protein